MHGIRLFFLGIFIPLIMECVNPVYASEDIAVITQHSSPMARIPFGELKQVYLRKSLLDSHGNRWIPVNLPPDHELRQRFSLALFNASPGDQEQYWNEQYFQGISPPEVLSSEEAIVRFVAITPGAIGYVHKGSVDARVKILALISTPVRN